MALYCSACGAKLVVRPQSPGVVYTKCDRCREEDLKLVDDVLGALLDD